ncbi:MAG: polyprenyl synthetase family protein [Alphaproteobacteria bacterium]
MYSDFLRALKETSSLVDEKISNLLPEIESGEDGRLAEAMRYSTLSPGKRLRPFLTVTCAKLFSVGLEPSLQVGAAIELIHAYSLIHDDLPGMDNDDVRRGQPSCHKKFDEATAILAGDALLTLAFEVLADSSIHHDASIRCELISQVARAIGVFGMAGGQMLDLRYSNKEVTMNEITRTQRMKTGALFAVACEAGAILGKAPKTIHTALRGYAHSIGLAFQIIDDLEDQEDKLANKPLPKASFVAVMGKQQAFEQAQILVEQAISHLAIFDHRASFLKDLARYILEQNK